MAEKKSTTKKKHVMLGNGFSIACRKDIFSYYALFDSADLESHPEIERLFEYLETTDFEEVIRALNSAMKVASAYGIEEDTFFEKVKEHSEKLKEILVTTIAKRHPEHPFEIDDEAYKHCRVFLSEFDNIYTLNYDILLYWALMRDDVDNKNLKTDDGFRDPTGSGEEDYVSWESFQSASVHFLHGALHLFDAGHELRKYTWSRTDMRIIDQVKEALDYNMFPLFVSEGYSQDKMNRIQHSGYLHKAYRSIGSVRGSMFIFGHSLAENDNHILERLMKSPIQNIFVSVLASVDDKSAFQKRLEELNSWVSSKKKKAFYLFDANSASVWG